MGSKTAAVLFKFTATYLGIDTFAYLSDLLSRLPSHPVDRLDELLPHRWKTAARHATAPADSS